MSSDISTNKKARRDYEILDTYEAAWNSRERKSNPSAPAR